MKQVELICSTVTSLHLAAYGVILRCGSHQKEMTRCFFGPPSEETLVMTGVIQGLEALKRPSVVTATFTAGTLPQGFMNTGTDLRDRWKKLADTHQTSWVYAEKCGTRDIQRCEDLALGGIEDYIRACELAAPAIPTVLMAIERFFLSPLVEIEVSKFVAHDEDGEDIWGPPVEITLGGLLATKTS